jgi:DNA-binding transcriptional LysR family regulator
VRELAALSAFDLGLAEAPFATGERIIRRYSFPRVAVLAEFHPLAKHKVLTPQLLNGVDLIATIRSSWSWASIVRAFDEAGSILRVVVECEFTAIALNLASAGAGICLIDPISAKSAGPGLVVRAFNPNTPYEVGLLSPAHSNLTILAQAFSDALHDHIAPYIVEN